MREWDTVRIAYEGCGTTLGAARRSTDYARMLQRKGSNKSTATLDHLGLTLMRAGQRCLPEGSLERAKHWQRLHVDQDRHGQFAELAWLIDTLREFPEGRELVEWEHQPILPLEMGAWDSRNPQPSCLGMTILVAAYALAASFEFLVASVQRVAGEPVSAGLRDLFDEAYSLVAELLPTTIQTDPLPGLLQSYSQEASNSLHQMTEGREFHGEVLFQLPYGYWAGLDPYMNSLAQYSPVRRPINTALDELKGGFDLAASVRGLPEWGALPGLENELDIIRKVLERIRAGMISPDLPLLELPGALRELMGRRLPKVDLNDSDILRQAVSAADEKPDEAAVRAIIAAAEHGPQRQNLRERILLGVVRAWAKRLWKVAGDAYMQEPPSAVILSHQHRSLAVWTIINLRYRAGLQPLAADLLPYSRSEVVIHNARIDRENGVELSPTEATLLEDRIALLRGARDEFLHPMLIPWLRSTQPG